MSQAWRFKGKQRDCREYLIYCQCSDVHGWGTDNETKRREMQFNVRMTMNRKITHKKRLIHCTYDASDNFIAIPARFWLFKNYSLNIEIRLYVCNAVCKLYMCIIVKWQKALKCAPSGSLFFASSTLFRPLQTVLCFVAYILCTCIENKIKHNSFMTLLFSPHWKSFLYLALFFLFFLLLHTLTDL